MEKRIRNKRIFPSQVNDLMIKLSRAGFFEDTMLVGSWLMPIYEDVFGIRYVLRTGDIDFAIQLVRNETKLKADIEKLMTGIGYLSIISSEGIQKFSRDNFSVEFVANRKGGSSQAITIKKWNISAAPLPFLNILMDFPFIADFDDYQVQAPLPEAFFFHKLIAAQRRLSPGKKEKDLEQCAIMADRLDNNLLLDVARSVKLSRETKRKINQSCRDIDFPPQRIGFE